MIHSWLNRSLSCAITLFFALSISAENPFIDNDSSDITRQVCDKLCITKILAECAQIDSLNSRCITSETVNSRGVCAQEMHTDSLCTRELNVMEQVCAAQITAPFMCTENINAIDICSNGQITANNIVQCGRYKATAVFAQETPYTLGNFIPWDTILDDPNGDVFLAPFAYIAPVSGYYILTAKINQKDLSGPTSIIGIPIANLELTVNGDTFREIFAPYLSFHNEQKLTLTALVSLNAGDVVQGRYHVYVMDDGAGFMPYPGTVNIQGSGNENNGSSFKIHYLSSDCRELPCQPCVTQCTPTTCQPCISCSNCDVLPCCPEGEIEVQ